MKKIGLMGCGKVAAYGHIPAILKTRGLDLVAVYDPFEESLVRLQENYEIPAVFTNLKEFLSSGIEAVTVTSPAPCHFQNVMDCAKAGLPVLCEKPVAMNKREGDLMVSAMADSQLSFYSGFCYRFSPVALRIRELIRSGSIGEVRTLRLIYNWHLHGRYEEDDSGARVLNQRREQRMEEGGPMVDCGTHQLDLANFWLNGDPVVRAAAHGSWSDGYVAPEHMWVHLDYRNGAHAMVEISYSYTHRAKNRRSDFLYELIGTHGVIRYERDSKNFYLENDRGYQELPYAEEKSFWGMYEEWEKALSQGTSALLTSAEEGVAVADLARRMTEQVIEGRGGQ